MSAGTATSMAARQRSDGPGHLRRRQRGREAAAVELDDFTVKTLHPRIAELLEDAVSSRRRNPEPRFKLAKKVRRRRSPTPNRQPEGLEAVGTESAGARGMPSLPWR